MSSTMSTRDTTARTPIDEPAQDAVAVFEAERPRLLGLAYRLLGSLVDAEDAVQEAWFRFDRTDPATINRPAAWLTTVVSRIGLDKLRARRRDQADYVGPWLPEPLVELGLSEAAGRSDSADPADAAVLADSLTTAFLVLLETLSPEERLTLLLVDVFGEPFSAVSAVLEKSDAATRQMASRARRKLREADPGAVDRQPASEPEQHEVASRLIVALAAGDVAVAAALLAPDVVLVSDGGALVHAARRPVVGVDRVVRLLVNLAKRTYDYDDTTLGLANTRPALVASLQGATTLVLTTEVVDGLVRRIYIFRNPDKLGALDHPVDLR